MDHNATPTTSTSTCKFYERVGMSNLSRRGTLYVAENVIRSSPGPVMDDWKARTNPQEFPSRSDATLFSPYTQTVEDFLLPCGRPPGAQLYRQNLCQSHLARSRQTADQHLLPQEQDGLAGAFGEAHVVNVGHTYLAGHDSNDMGEYVGEYAGFLNVTCANAPLRTYFNFSTPAT